MDGQDYRMLRINNMDFKDGKDRCYKKGHYSIDCNLKDSVNLIDGEGSYDSNSYTDSDRDANDKIVMYVRSSGHSRQPRRDYARYFR